MSSRPSSSPGGRQTPRVSLRPARPDDVDALTDIFLEARATTMAYVPTLYSRAEIRDWIAGDLLGHCEVIAACLATEVAGFSVRRGDWLEQLYIRPDRQCGGIGSLLVDRAKRGCSGTLRLHVFQQNLRARRFYARHGFRVECLRDKTQNEENVADMVCIWQARA